MSVRSFSMSADYLCLDLPESQALQFQLKHHLYMSMMRLKHQQIWINTYRLDPLCVVRRAWSASSQCFYTVRTIFCLYTVRTILCVERLHVLDKTTQAHLSVAYVQAGYKVYLSLVVLSVLNFKQSLLERGLFAFGCSEFSKLQARLI